MTEKKKETVNDVMSDWNQHRQQTLDSLDLASEKDASVTYLLLQTSVWLDRLFNAHLREGKTPPRKGRGPSRPKEIIPNNGIKAVE